MNISTVYIIISSIAIIISIVRINQLETLVGASVDRKIPTITSPLSYYATCVWVNGDESMIHEFVAAHLSRGFLDYRFYVDDPNTTFIHHIESNYTNLGLPIKFIKKNDKQGDIWECITENIFEPTTSSVLVTEVDAILFPLYDKYQRLSSMNDHICTTFDEFSFVDSGDNDTRYPLSKVSTHRRRVMSNRSGSVLFKLGDTVDERITFLKSFKRKIECIQSTTYGSAKYTNDSVTGKKHFVRDNRPFDMKELYHVNNFNY
jgi:hypothetical protein